MAPTIRKFSELAHFHSIRKLPLPSITPTLNIPHIPPALPLQKAGIPLFPVFHVRADIFLSIPTGSLNSKTTGSTS